MPKPDQKRMLATFLAACEKVGGQAALARKLGVGYTTVYSWADRGLPVGRVLDVERVTGVPRHELRPDIYPPPA